MIKRKYAPLLVMIGFAAGCETLDRGPATVAQPPACSQLAQLLPHANNLFATIRTGPLISETRSDNYWRSTQSIPSADYCRIMQRPSGATAFECTWNFKDRPSMKAFFRKVADRLTSCVGNVLMERDDIYRFATVNLIPTGRLSRLEYNVNGWDLVGEYSVTFAIEAM